MQKKENLLRDIFIFYIKYWPYFLLSFFISISLCIAYIKYTPKRYQIITRIMITDEKKGKVTTTTIYDDLGIVASSNIDNEIEVLKSRSLMKLVVESLGYDVSYYSDNKYIKSGVEIPDKNLPLKVKINKYKNPGIFSVSRSHVSGFDLRIRYSDTVINANMNIPFEFDLGKFTIVQNQLIPFQDSIIIKIKDSQILPIVTVKAVNKTSSIVELSTVTTNVNRGINILKELINTYNKQTIENKNEVSINTLKFIDARLDSIAYDLYIAESRVELYKKENKLTNIVNEGKLATLSSEEYSKKISDTQIQLSMLSLIRDYVLDPEEENKIIPFDIGVKDPIIIDLIQKYNDLLLKKTEMQRSVKNINPSLIDLKERTVIIKNNLLNSISNTQKSLNLIIDELNKEENKYIQILVDLPTQEKEYEIYERQKSIKEASYRYLIQKKEETTLTLAMTIPNAQVIDTAYAELTPVTPKRNMVFLLGVILGILIPAIMIYILNLIDKKVRNREEVLDTITIPMLDEISLAETKKNRRAKHTKDFELNESFRRAAINIYSISKKENNKIISITSTIDNEKKTTMAINIASYLTQIGEKVVLLDANLRDSNLEKYLELEPKVELTTYLASDQYVLSDLIIHREGIMKMDIIPSAHDVSNPISYLNSKNMHILIQDLSDIYDYIIIDTPPISLYSDMFIINQFTNYTLYTIRINQTLKRNLAQIEQLYSENKLNNMYCILIN